MPPRVRPIRWPLLSSSLAATQKNADASRKKLADLRTKAPGIIKDAQAAKMAAEKSAASAEKELAAAKSEAEKRRAAFEAVKASAAKPANLQRCFGQALSADWLMIFASLCALPW